jgi:oligopeptide transport system substrate-binding protein
MHFGRLIGHTLSWITVSAALISCSQDVSRVEAGNRDGIFHFGNGTEPQALDPHTTVGVPESHISWAIFEGLVTLHPTTLEPIPGVADSWEISDDQRTYRFHIRDNARWSNGEPITAEDFRWSWWRALQPALGNEYAYMLFPVKNAEAYFTGKITAFDQVGVKAINDHLLEVQLNEPIPYFLQLLFHHSTHAVPRSVIEKFGKATDRFSDWTRPENIVSNGPFMVKEWKLYKHVRVVKNPFYWDAANVRLNEVMFYPTENITTEERMYKSNQLHRTEYMPLDKVQWYKANKPDELHLNRYLGSYFYRLNVTDPVLKDARVRKALGLAIDREQLINNVLNGVHFPAYTLTPPGLSNYQPPNIISFDPNKAKALLAEAGYPDGKNFPRIELMFNTHEQHRRIAVAVQQMWKQHLNIDIDIANVEWKVYLDNMSKLHYTATRSAWIGDYVDPNTFLDMFITGSGNNRTGWSNKEYDDLLLRKIPAAKSPAERLAGFHAAETILLDEMPIIPIYIYSTQHLIKTQVKGLPDNLLDFVSFKDVYLEAN